MAQKIVTFIMPSLHIGGGNRVFIELARELVVDNVVEIIISATVADRPAFPVDGRVKLIRVGLRSSHPVARLLNMLLLQVYAAVMKRQNIVIISDPILSLFNFMLKGDSTYRFLQSHDYIIFDDLYLLKSRVFLGIYKAFTKLSYRYRVHYIFNSRFVYDSFIKVSKRQDVPCQLVHPGVNLINFHNTETRSSKIVNISIVGRAHPLKGFADFIKAWVELKSELTGIVEKVFVISPDSLEQFDLSGLTLVKPSHDKDMALVYNQSHIFISSSWWDGFGLPPLEAMACGCAVVLSDSGGADEYAVPGKNCLMYPSRDIEGLKRSISALVKDQAFMNTLMKNGQATSQQFTWRNASIQLKNIIFSSTSQLNSL